MIMGRRHDPTELMVIGQRYNIAWTLLSPKRKYTFTGVYRELDGNAVVLVYSRKREHIPIKRILSVYDSGGLCVWPAQEQD